jgi:FtsH-binding integral membrane protein
MVVDALRLLSAARWERLIVLAPVFLVAFGLVAAVFLLLARGFAQTVREAKHPRWIVAALVGLVGAIVLMTYLGVELPREGG